MADFFKTNFKAQTPGEEPLQSIFDLLTPEEKVQYSKNFQPTTKERVFTGLGGVADVISSAGGGRNDHYYGEGMQKRSDNRIGQDMQFVGNELTRKYAERQAKAAAEKAGREGSAFKSILDDKYPQLDNQDLTSENAWDYYKTMIGDDRMRDINEENARTRRSLGSLRSGEKSDDAIDKLRKELLMGPHAKNRNFINVAARANQSIQEYNKNPTAYSDFATMLGGVKALQSDDSVVREAEQRGFAAATSLPNRIKNWEQALSTGKKLQQSQREDMANTLRVLTESANNVYRSGIEPVYNRAKAQNLPLDQIFLKDDLDFYNAKKQPTIPEGFVKGTDNGEEGYIGPDGLFYTMEEMSQ